MKVLLNVYDLFYILFSQTSFGLKRPSSVDFLREKNSDLTAIYRGSL